MDRAAAPRLSLLGGWRLELPDGPALTDGPAGHDGAGHDGAGRNGHRAEPVPPAMQRLIALLAARGRSDRRTVAGTLFAGRPDDVAAARLRDTLSRLRHRHPRLAELIDTEPDLCLTATLQVDLLDLDAVIGSCARGEVGALEALEQLAPAPADLDLLPGWYDDWVCLERERLRSKVSRALCRHSGLRLRVGDAAGALASAEWAGRLDPFDEVAARWQIRAHLRFGDDALAVRRYVELRDRLGRELSVEPDPATAALLPTALSLGRS